MREKRGVNLKENFFRKINSKFIKVTVLFLFFFGFIAFFISFSSAYGMDSNYSTHQHITKEAGEIWTSMPLEIDDHLFNSIDDSRLDRDYDSDIGDDIITGSAEEDLALSTILWVYRNHFWDPDEPNYLEEGSYNRNLFGDGSLYRKALDYWMNDVIPYYTGRNENNLIFTNHDIDQDQSYYMLGRTAHLLEDAAQPSHVLLDSHSDKFLDGSSILEDWAGENFSQYDGSDYSNKEYNYNNLIDNFNWSSVQPNDLTEDQLNLFKLFWYTAQKTQYWASDDKDGNFIYTNLDNNLQNWSCSGSGDNNLWADEYTLCNDFINDHNDFSKDNVEQEADAVIPHAMKAVAGLYQLFWDTVRNELRLNPIDSNKQEVRGGVRQNGVWKTELDVANSNSKDIQIRLIMTDNCNDNLSLTLSNPSKTINYSASGEDCGEVLRLDNPTQGMWEAIIEGVSVSEEIQEFEVSVGFVDEESVDSDDVGGVNFTSINLDYISTCDSGDIKLIMKGDEAQGNDPIVNVTEATEQATDFFLTALVIPDHRMWITMDTKPGSGFLGKVGDVSRVDDNLAHTKLGQIMFDADIQLKMDHFGQSQNLIEGLINDWVDDVSHDANIVPEFYARVWISSDFIQANGTGCEIFITNSSLKVESEIISVSLGVGGYESELADFKTDE